MSKPLLKRFLASKYLLMRAGEALDRGGPFAAGVSILSLHDATEMLLRTVGEHLDVSISENSPFRSIIDAIEKKSGAVLTQRSSLNQLNKARVGFKHFGLEPKSDDANKLRKDMEVFFPKTLSTIAGIDINSLSLASLVGHRRTENWLNKAQDLIDSGEFAESISASAVAFAVFRHLFDDKRHRMRSRECDPKLVGN